MLWVIAASGALLLPVTIEPLDRVCARTTLRLWHELYSSQQRTTHDFADVFGAGANVDNASARQT